MTSPIRRLRCAIYTRKSSEEGLEQDFNSLDAQREACEAYVRSQVEQGWQVVRQRYDDGGYSGGTLQRPALQQLLADVRERRLDVIVIYKIDRLTRSLTDFAQLAELLDTHSVSFVSVTQQFNTTTSMGRLMLNVLLSFAQFEREITGERIRDKIAASKKKGLWMGGIAPLGYRADGRTLVIEDSEADTIRQIFRLYLESGSVRLLASHLEERGVRTRHRMTSSGRQCGNCILARGHLYKILQNPIYVGRIRHRGATYEGQHPAIIDAATWERVQQQLGDNLQGHHHRTRAREPSLLAGLLRDDKGTRLVPAHSTKGQRRYRYYIQERATDGAGKQLPMRLPAPEVEGAVKRTLLDALESPHSGLALLQDRLSASQTDIAMRSAASRANELRQAGPGRWQETIRALVEGIELRAASLVISVRVQALGDWLGVGSNYWAATEIADLIAPVRVAHRGNQVRLIIGAAKSDRDLKPDETIRALMARAWAWRQRLEGGQVNSLDEIATAEKVTSSYVGRVLRMAYLAPDIIEAVVRGEHPVELTAQQLLYRHELSIDWRDQRQQLGMA